MEEFSMKVTLEIYGPHGQNLRLMEEIRISNSMTLQQAAAVLQQFSDLARHVKTIHTAPK